jgi:hypothetical protein
MASKQYEFWGTTYYAQVFGKGDEKYKRWKCPLVLDNASQNLFDKSGLQLQANKTADGKTFYNFARPFAKMIKDEMVKFEAPEVINDLGEPFAEALGNGSEVKIQVAVYDTFKGKGHRLEKIKVVKHVPYNKVITPDDVDLPPV